LGFGSKNSRHHWQRCRFVLGSLSGRRHVPNTYCEGCDVASIRAFAARFDMGESDLRDILKAETDRASDGAQMRAEWMLTARRLRAVASEA